MLSLHFWVMEKMVLDLCCLCTFGVMEKYLWSYAFVALLGSWKNVFGVILSLHFWAHGKMFLDLCFNYAFGVMEQCFWLYAFIAVWGHGQMLLLSSRDPVAE